MLQEVGRGARCMKGKNGSLIKLCPIDMYSKLVTVCCKER